MPIMYPDTFQVHRSNLTASMACDSRHRRTQPVARTGTRHPATGRPSRTPGCQEVRRGPPPRRTAHALEHEDPEPSRSRRQGCDPSDSPLLGEPQAASLPHRLIRPAFTNLCRRADPCHVGTIGVSRENRRAPDVKERPLPRTHQPPHEKPCFPHRYVGASHSRIRQGNRWT